MNMSAHDRPNPGKALYDAGFKAGLEAERSDNADWLRCTFDYSVCASPGDIIEEAAREIERGVIAPAAKARLWLQFSDCGQHIRKWSREPFEGAALFSGFSGRVVGDANAARSD